MKATWSLQEEAERLAARFVGINQAAFARAHGIPGGASMLSQHIKGRRPLNLVAAIAYARGFGVPLEDISPRLAEEVGMVNRLSEGSSDTGLAHDMSQARASESFPQMQWGT